MGWESFGVVGFDLGTLLQGQTIIAASLLFVLPDASNPNYYGVKSFEVY